MKPGPSSGATDGYTSYISAAVFVASAKPAHYILFQTATQRFRVQIQQQQHSKHNNKGKGVKKKQKKQCVV